MPLPLMYTEYASWFHLLTHPDDYQDEAAAYVVLLREAVHGPLASLLELGAGGGNNASWYKREIPNVTLTDLAPDMIAISRTINPELEHIQGDMRTLRLGREFDAVFVHDAIGYMTTESDLRACFQTAAAHLRPGGAALFVPDCVRETFTAHADHGGHDSRDGARGLRYLEWVWDRDPADTVYQAEYAYLMRDGDDVRAAQDHHDEGLFPEAAWVSGLEWAGFDMVDVRRMEWEDDADSQVAFLVRKPR